MSAEKKARSDASLKTLSPEQQAEIYSRLTVKRADWQDTSLRAVRAWLQQDGVETSERALSEFGSWYGLQSQFRQDEVTTESLLEQFRRDVPGLTDAQLDELGQKTFSLLAIRRQDLEGFVSIRSAKTNAELERAKLKLKERAEDRQASKLRLDIQKFQFDAIAACRKHLPALKTIEANKGLSEQQKTQMWMQTLFGKKPE
jgi:hypothetical protein